MKIEGLPAIVTGGGSGLGEATARHLAAEGMKVALLDLNIEGAQRVADDIGGLAIECDVTSEESMTNALKTAADAHGKARLLVTCAGILPAGRVVGRDGPMPMADFEAGIKVNLFGTFNALRLVAADMYTLDPLDDDGERGVIVMVSSISAFEGQLGQASYSASKGAVAGMTLPIAREFAKFGIRVASIAPGVMGTPMIKAAPQKVQDSLVAQACYPQRLGEPSEFALFVSQIAENKLLNGSVLRLDGGMHLCAT